MTKKEMFTEIINLANANAREDIAEFAKKEIALLANRTNSSKPSKKQMENELIKVQMVDMLAAVGKPMTISQMVKEPAFAMYSPNKISALMTQLKNAHIVERNLVKKVAYFSVAKAESEVADDKSVPAEEAVTE